MSPLGVLLSRGSHTESCYSWGFVLPPRKVSPFSRGSSNKVDPPVSSETIQAQSGSNPTNIVTSPWDPYAALFAHPFTAAMVELNEDVYDLTAVTDTDFAALMTWLYAGGWGFATETRATIDLCPPASAEAKSRVWFWDTNLYGVKPRVVITRFCREGEACPHKATTCNFTHGDMIHCVNKACGFDKPAEGKCCAGEKRKTCIFMHASEGQIWSPALVVRRP